MKRAESLGPFIILIAWPMTVSSGDLTGRDTRSIDSAANVRFEMFPAEIPTDVLDLSSLDSLSDQAASGEVIPLQSVPETIEPNSRATRSVPDLLEDLGSGKNEDGLDNAHDPVRSARRDATAPQASQVSTLPADRDSLRRLILEAPEKLGSLSIGRPDAGALFGAVPMPDGRLWFIRNPLTAWATEETVRFLTAAIEMVEARFPGSPMISIGDLSRQFGGRCGRHKSHESGRDADIGWYVLDGLKPVVRRGVVKNLDLARCWAFLRVLVTATDVERVFIDRAIQRVLYHFALSQGEDRDWLAQVFECAAGRRETLIQHERNHRSHMHARFHNQKAQEWGRQAHAALVEAQLVPPPVLKHRARRGDTLSTLARHYGVSMKAIRYANGLRSSRLRAGRVYRIPTCVVADGGPIVVPSRRLPPTEDGPMAINEPALPEPPVIAAGKQVSHLSIHP